MVSMFRGAVMIAAALSFNSGILLFADAEQARGRTRDASTKIFHRRAAAASGCAQFVLVVGDAIGWAADAIERCEEALAAMPPGTCTIDRMRDVIEQTLFASYQEQVDRPAADVELSALVALYSPTEQRYELFHTLNTSLRPVAAHDCVGAAAYLGHYLIRDRYNAARSMDALDLETVFAIAADTLEGIRACKETCGASSEIAVMYADGHVSDVQRIPQDTEKQREEALSRLAHA
jgi:hypothetical protein